MSDTLFVDSGGRTDFALFAARLCNDDGKIHTVQTLEKLVAHLQYLPEDQKRFVGSERANALQIYENQLNSISDERSRSRRNLKQIADNLAASDKLVDGKVKSVALRSLMTRLEPTHVDMPARYRSFGEDVPGYLVRRPVCPRRTWDRQPFNWRTFTPVLGERVAAKRGGVSPRGRRRRNYQ